MARSGKSRYRLCKETDIDPASMSRFMAGQTDLSLAAAGRIMEVLGLEVVPNTPKGKQAAGKSRTAKKRGTKK